MGDLRPLGRRRVGHSGDMAAQAFPLALTAPSPAGHCTAVRGKGRSGPCVAHQRRTSALARHGLRSAVSSPLPGLSLLPALTGYSSNSRSMRSVSSTSRRRPGPCTADRHPQEIRCRRGSPLRPGRRPAANQGSRASPDRRGRVEGHDWRSRLEHQRALNRPCPHTDAARPLVGPGHTRWRARRAPPVSMPPVPPRRGSIFERPPGRAPPPTTVDSKVCVPGHESRPTRMRQ